MTDEEIDVSLAHLEQSAHAETFTSPRTLWTLCGVMVLPAFIPQVGWAFGLLSALMGAVAWVDTRGRQSEWGDFQKRRALSIWREWREREAPHELKRHLSRTVVMRDQILKIYQDDPRGTVFPLKQAMRLVNTCSRQEERLEEINDHLSGLREVRAQLLEKSAQLEHLGEKNLKLQTTLQKIEHDVGPLESLNGEIESSFRRLEVLLFSVRRAIEIKQIHSEIEEIAANVVSDSSAPNNLEENAAFIDIERQITREVETFLQLERDSDRHLREL